MLKHVSLKKSCIFKLLKKQVDKAHRKIHVLGILMTSAAHMQKIVNPIHLLLRAWNSVQNTYTTICFQWLKSTKICIYTRCIYSIEFEMLIKKMCSTCIFDEWLQIYWGLKVF